MRSFPGSTDQGEHVLHVRGGAAGTAVGLDSLDAAACVLADVAQDVAVLAWGVAGAATDIDLVAGSALSPATGARAEAAIVAAAGQGGLASDVAGLLTLSAALVAATQSYRRAEELATSGVEQAQDAVMFVVGAMSPQVVVGVLTLDALGVDVAALLDEAVFEEPGIADLAGGVEGLALGLRANPLTAPFLTAGARSDGLGPRQDYERAVRALADSAALWGLMSDRGRVQVTAEPTPRPGARVPRSLQELAADQRNVGDAEDYPGHVRVIEVPQARGSAWIVEISGTQVWDPRAAGDPLDVTTDVHAMAQDATVLADGVQQALAQAQAASVSVEVSLAAGGGLPGAGEGPQVARSTSSEPVMLVGHSLGGIAAAGLASSPRFTQAHEVTHVFTMGSPVGRMPVPAGVEVLSLEHTQDAVPRLDGEPNPDRSTWVTVTRDLRGEGLDRASQAHDTRLYVDTAALVDSSSDPSVATWRTSSEPFFDGDTYGDPVVRDFKVERAVG